jgi:hypothetical protein
VSSDEELLCERLERLLGPVRPGPPPVTTVIRKGRLMRAGQWLTGAAAVVAACGLGVGVYAVLQPGSGQAAVGRHHLAVVHRLQGRPHERVYRLPAVAWGGVFAAGDETGPHSNGRWQLWVDAHTGLVYSQVGTSVTWELGSLRDIGSDNGVATFYNADEEGISGVYAVVAPVVTSVKVTYSTGQQVTLYPVSAAGERWVGQVTWFGVYAVSYIAYHGTAELAHLVTYGGTPVSWLPPGGQGPARQNVRIGSGFVPAHSHRVWQADVAAGQWGFCVTLQGAPPFSQACLSVQAVRSTGAKLVVHGLPRWVGTWVVGTASAHVSYLTLYKADGQTVRVPTAVVDGIPFYAFAIVHGEHIVRWAAYSAAGTRLYGGGGRPAIASGGPESVTAFSRWPCAASIASTPECTGAPNWRT